MLLSGYNDPLSMFYQLDGLSSATALMTPEEAASVRTVDDSKQTQTDLTVAVVVLAILVVLLLVAGFVYFTLRLMKPKAKIAPAAPAPEPQNFDPEAQPAGVTEMSGELPDGASEL
jgi:flagellar basal body-associated protein FliL